METFGYLEIFDFFDFLFCKFLIFYSVTWLDLSPSKFAFSTKDKMKLYEFLLHINNKKCVLPIKVIFSYITPYIGGAAKAFC